MLAARMAENHDHWCFCWPNVAPCSAWKDRAALVLAAKWPSKPPISISFLDDPYNLQAKVQAAAEQWTKPGRARLILAFLNDTNETDIRISFKQPGSWSMLGKFCRQRTDLALPTMNFGTLNASSSDLEIERVVLHEFGHALGLVHEHQSPMAHIQWNKPAVYADLEGVWDRATIDANVFDPVAAQKAAATSFDEDSIMVYPIKSSWTLDGFSSNLNTQLSPTDILFIGNVYP